MHNNIIHTFFKFHNIYLSASSTRNSFFVLKNNIFETI